MEERQCLACGDSFVPCRTVKNQKYCSKYACQRERKRRWERAKLSDEIEYRENRQNAQKQWRENNPDYWCNYRRTHRKYVKRNRERQRERNVFRRIQTRLIAKTDASDPAPLPILGPFELVVSRKDLIANKDEIKAAMRFVSRCSVGIGG